MVNRLESPKYKQPEHLNVPEANKCHLDNGISVQYIQGGTQEVCKIDFIFSAGMVQSVKPLVASFTNSLMQEGTENMSSFEIAEKVDFYGAYMDQSIGLHYAQVSLFVLTKYIPKLLPIIEEVIKRPVFEQHEFDIYRDKKRHSFLIGSEKVKVLAHRKSQEVLFSNHPYGRVTKLKYFDDIERDDLKLFHKKQYASNLCNIIVSGQGGDDFKVLLNKYFGGDDWSIDSHDKIKLPEIHGERKRFFLIDKSDAKQSAIRIVRHSVNKTHEDYLPIQVLNTVLGGYFGSRLMNNLREEKGLTYGISSYVTSFLTGAVWGVATEVVAENRDLAVNEIFAEMGKLQNNMIEEEELSRVKNYMLGELQRNLDGPFSVSDAYCRLMGFDLDINFYHNFTEIIKNVSPEQLQKLAKKYLDPQDFYTIVAGK